MDKPSKIFKIESLIDKEGEYIGIFCAKTGNLLRHEGTLLNHPKKEESKPEQEKEVRNENQLNLF